MVVGSPLGFFSEPLLPPSPLPTFSCQASLLLAALPLLHEGTERSGFLPLLPPPPPSSWLHVHVHVLCLTQRSPGFNWGVSAARQGVHAPPQQQFFQLKDVQRSEWTFHPYSLPGSSEYRRTARTAQPRPLPCSGRVCPGSRIAPPPSPALLQLLPAPTLAEVKAALSTSISFAITSYRHFGAKSSWTMAL